MKRLKRKAKHEGKGEETKADIKDKTFQAVFEEAARGRVDDVRAAELTQGLLGWPGFRLGKPDQVHLLVKCWI